MFSALIEKLMRREDLTSEEAAAAMAEVMEGRAADAQIAALLDRPGDERRAAGGDRRPGAHDAGARGDALAPVRRRVRHLRHRRRSFRYVQHLVRASRSSSPRAGVRVAKHGNRSVSSLSGSADVFEALGVRVTAPPAVVERCLAEAGIGFFFAPTFHPSMRHAGPTRKALGVRTAFNLLGPLTNPAGASRQLVGVPRPEFTELLARALLLLGSERAWVVHGADGIDEISTTGYTKISECRGGAVNTFYLHPADVGLPKAHAGGDARRNCRTRTRGSSGRFSRASAVPARDVVLLNAGAALFIAGKAASIEDGMAQAAARHRSRRCRRGRSSGWPRCRRPRNRPQEPEHDDRPRRRRPARDHRRRDAADRRGACRSGSRLRRWRSAPSESPRRPGASARR